jgi:hypothetical protein
MAKAYKALSNIDHGEGSDPQTGAPLGKYFAYGELVVGLDSDTMKQLWDAGVLEEVDVPDVLVKDAEDKQRAADDERARAAAEQQASSGDTSEQTKQPAAETRQPSPPAGK